MHQDTSLIMTIVAGLVLAYMLGMLANRLRLPPLLGYLLAGIVVGPHTLGFTTDAGLGAQLAELGVILLMFGVGLRFLLKDLMSARALAISGAVVQIGFTTLLGAGLGLLLGWDLGGALLFGLALSIASSVVLFRAVQDRHTAAAWLSVEALVVVLAMVLLPALASLSGTNTGIHDPFVSFAERLIGAELGFWAILALTAIKMAAFVGFMLIAGRRFIPWMLQITAHAGSRELFRLALLAIALGVALGSAVLFGVPLALGAFFAGMMLAENEPARRAAHETLPLREAFAVVFFVAIGMLLDPMILMSQPLAVLATILIIVIGKWLAAFAMLLLFRRPVASALTVAASLAQIGEFSFILAGMGVALAILPPQGLDLILVGITISILLNPLVFWGVALFRPRFEARFDRQTARGSAARVEPGVSAPAAADLPSQAAGAPGADDDEAMPARRVGHTVLVGYGEAGRIVAEGLKADGVDLVVIEDDDHALALARAAGLAVIPGNAAHADVLKLAHPATAKTLLATISNAFEAGAVCKSARKLNPGMAIVARAASAEEEEVLRDLGASTVIRDAREVGKGMLAHLRADGSSAAEILPEPATKLPVVENILAQAAGGAVASVAVVDMPERVEVEAETAVEAAPVAEIDVAALPVIEAVVDEAPAPVAPEIAEDIELPEAELVALEPVPSLGDAPAQIDEVLPWSEPEPAVTSVGEAPVEPPAEPVNDAETSEPAGPDDETEADENKTDENKTEADVPPVMPEPKP
ncbi:MAG: cation:proton antiporter [Devosia sp.]|nr:cation:proton antiporter [Devosia sp.]